MSACAGDTRIEPSPLCANAPHYECCRCGAPLCGAHACLDNRTDRENRMLCLGCSDDVNGRCTAGDECDSGRVSPSTGGGDA